MAGTPALRPTAKRFSPILQRLNPTRSIRRVDQFNLIIDVSIVSHTGRDICYPLRCLIFHDTLL
jgi:hypothetical protein